MQVFTQFQFTIASVLLYKNYLRRRCTHAPRLCSGRAPGRGQGRGQMSGFPWARRGGQTSRRRTIGARATAVRGGGKSRRRQTKRALRRDSQPVGTPVRRRRRPPGAQLASSFAFRPAPSHLTGHGARLIVARSSVMLSVISLRLGHSSL